MEDTSANWCSELAWSPLSGSCNNGHTNFVVCWYFLPSQPVKAIHLFPRLRVMLHTWQCTLNFNIVACDAVTHSKPLYKGVLGRRRKISSHGVYIFFLNSSFEACLDVWCSKNRKRWRIPRASRDVSRGCQYSLAHVGPPIDFIFLVFPLTICASLRK